jgi:hypothetical protein
LGRHTNSRGLGSWGRRMGSRLGDMGKVGGVAVGHADEGCAAGFGNGGMRTEEDAHQAWGQGTWARGMASKLGDMETWRRRIGGSGWWWR